MTVSRGSQEFSFPLRLAAYWQASLCFVLLALPCNANGLSGSVMHPVEAINMVSQLSGLFFFILFVVYLGAAGSLLARKHFRQGLIDASLACLSFALLVAEPKLLNMLLYSGLQFPVKLSLQFALAAICALISLGLLVLPSILAFTTGYRSKVNILLMNLSGCLIFPLFILALYMVQSKITSGSEEAVSAVSGASGAIEAGEDFVPDNSASSAVENEEGSVEEGIAEEKAR